MMNKHSFPFKTALLVTNASKISLIDKNDIFYLKTISKRSEFIKMLYKY